MADEALERHTVGAVYVAHPAVVNGFHRAFVAQQYVHVGTGHAQGIHATCLQSCHDALVHQSAVNHSHHLQHLVVGDSASVHHFCFDAQTFSHSGGKSAAAVHQQFVVFNRGKVAEQSVERCGVLANLAAHFHNGKFLHNGKIKWMR